MPTLRDAMLEAELAREAAARRSSRFVGGERFQAPMEEGIAPSVGGTLAAAADPFYLPSYAVGKISPEARDAWREYSDENPSDRIFGSFAPVPFLGPAAAAAKTVAQPVINTVKAFPKTMGAVLGLTGATEAAEGSKQIRERANEYTPEATRLKEKIADQEAELKWLGEKAAPEPKQYKNPRAQKAAEDRAKEAGTRITKQMDTLRDNLETNRSRLKEVQNIQDRITKEAGEKEKTEQPLVEQQPWMKQLPYAGAVVAGATAYSPRLRAVMRQRALTEELDPITREAFKSASAAPGKKGFSGKDVANIETAREAVKTGRELKEAGEGSWGKALTAAPAGALVALEAGMLPYQLDYATAGRDTPAFRTAEDRFWTGEGWLKTAMQGFPGLVGGGLGAKAPTYKAPDPRLDAMLARGQGAVNAFDMRQAALAAQPAAAAPAAAPRLAAGPIPAVPALTREAAIAKRSAAPERDLTASQRRVDEARTRMDEAFKAAGSVELTPRRREIMEKIDKAKSAAELRNLFNEFWR